MLAWILQGRWGLPLAPPQNTRWLRRSGAEAVVQYYMQWAQGLACNDDATDSGCVILVNTCVTLAIPALVSTINGTELLIFFNSLMFNFICTGILPAYV